MRWLNRLTDILSASLNDLVERYEDPELLLKQAVREMDESIRAALQDAVKVVAHERILARQLADEESAVTLSRRHAEAAVQRGEDHLARQALRQKRDREAVCASLSKQLEESTAVGQSLRRQIETMRRRAEEANRKLLLLAARQRAAKARQRLLREFSLVPIGEDAFQKFERMCRKVERTEAEADALAEMTGGRETVFEPPAGRMGTGDNEIEAELEALKAQAGV